ncbi:hypothetical protein ACLOJK_008118 [Asimina triloba]
MVLGTLLLPSCTSSDLAALESASSSSSTQVFEQNPDAVERTALQIFHLMKGSRWKDNEHLRLMVSHLKPEAAVKVIELQRGNPDLGLRFMEWKGQ